MNGLRIDKILIIQMNNIPLGVAFNVCTAMSSEAFSRLTSFTHVNWSPGSRPPFNAAGLPGTRLLIIMTVSSSSCSYEEEGTNQFVFSAKDKTGLKSLKMSIQNCITAFYEMNDLKGTLGNLL